eukprot:COSAG01_NODE_6391_length_3697_cov_6.264314_4_plen_98_part_00
MVQHAGPHGSCCGTIGTLRPTDAGAPSGRCCALALARPRIRLCRALCPNFPAPSNVNAFTLDDDADSIQLPPLIAAPPQKQARQVGLSMAVEEDDDS